MNMKSYRAKAAYLTAAFLLSGLLAAQSKSATTASPESWSPVTYSQTNIPMESPISDAMMNVWSPDFAKPFSFASPQDAMISPQGGSGYVRAVPECGHQEFRDNTLFIVNICSISVNVVFTSSGDVSGGMPLGPGEHGRTGFSREAAQRVGGVDVYTCPGDATPLDPNGRALSIHYKGEYLCHR
jgi:hypothetical protein